MEHQSSPFIQFIPLLLLSIGLGFQALFLAKDKGRNVLVLTIFGFFPFVNLFCIWYLIGASNLRHNRMLQDILQKLEEQ